jgi:diguanylate cyclase (GGDEF)-like protein
MMVSDLGRGRLQHELLAARPSPTTLAGAALLSFGLIVAAAVTAPFGNLKLGPNPGFLPAFGGITFFGDLITALLLFSRARALNERSLARLGAAFLFNTFIIVPFLASFPDLFGKGSLIGTSASAVWLWVFWHGGFALGLAAFAATPPGACAKPVRVLLPVMLVAAVVAVLAALATLGQHWLPVIIVGGSYRRLTTLGIGPAVLCCCVLALVLIGRRLRQPTPLAVWLTVATVALTADVSLTLLGTDRFSLGWYVARTLSGVSQIAVMSGLLIDLSRLFHEVATANHRLERLSLTDPLTELANRRGFDRWLATEWSRAVREQLPLSLAVIDVDYFKRYNDCFGHSAGDGCLIQVAATIGAGARRPADLAARIGGEEFAVVLSQTDERGASAVAEVVRASVEALSLPHPESSFQRVTISVGVATVRPFEGGKTARGLLEAADAALYQAKRSGRNCVRRSAAFEIDTDSFTIPLQEAVSV